MSVATPVSYRTTIPARRTEHPPLSPDSFRATPSSTPAIYHQSFPPLPYVLAPDSRPTSPTSKARIEAFAKQIRDHEVQRVYVIAAKLKGPFGPGASGWGRATGTQESYDDQDLVLAESEEHAIELEKKNEMGRAASTGRHTSESLGAPLRVQAARPASVSSSRSDTLPVPVLTAPQATSTPANSAAKNSSLKRPLSQTTLNFSPHRPLSQSTLNFPLSKPAVARTQEKPDSHKSSSQPTSSPAAKPTTSRFFTGLLETTKSRTPRMEVRSSQPTPFHSQFDMDGRVKEISDLLDEDGFEVDRGIKATVIDSDDED